MPIDEPTARREPRPPDAHHLPPTEAFLLDGQSAAAKNVLVNLLRGYRRTGELRIFGGRSEKIADKFARTLALAH
jgi:hypothetical protein